eukprot:3019137-Amphidinium_carterae.3
MSDAHAAWSIRGVYQRRDWVPCPHRQVAARHCEGRGARSKLPFELILPLPKAARHPVWVVFDAFASSACRPFSLPPSALMTKTCRSEQGACITSPHKPDLAAIRLPLHTKSHDSVRTNWSS